MIVRVEGDGRAAVAELIGERPECVTVFGADRCADCRRAKAWLARHRVPFAEFDTDADETARARAVLVAGGRPNIPVLVAPDGLVLVEPTNRELAGALAAYRRPRGAAPARCR